MDTSSSKVPALQASFNPFTSLSLHAALLLRTASGRRGTRQRNLQVSVIQGISLPATCRGLRPLSCLSHRATMRRPISWLVKWSSSRILRPE